MSYLILPKVSRFSFEIENVGLEPLLCVPNAACCLNTSFSIKLLQRESNPRLRRDSPVYWPLYDEAIFLYADRLVPARVILFIKLSLAALDIDRVNGNDFVYRNIEHCSKDHHVVDRRHGCSVDPLVDRLRCRESEDLLHITHSHSCPDTHTVDDLSGSDSVDHRENHLPHLLYSGSAGTQEGRSFCLFYCFSDRFIRISFP